MLCPGLPRTCGSTPRVSRPPSSTSRCSLTPESTMISYYGEAGPRPAGTVLTVDFSLDGQEFTGNQRRPRVHVRRGRLVRDLLRRPGGDRLLLDQAFRGRRGGPVRLAEGPLRLVLAGGPGRVPGADERPRPGTPRPGHASHPRHEEARHGGHPGRGRRGVSHRSSCPSAGQRSGRSGPRIGRPGAGGHHPVTPDSPPPGSSHVLPQRFSIQECKIRSPLTGTATTQANMAMAIAI